MVVTKPKIISIISQIHGLIDDYVVVIKVTHTLRAQLPPRGPYVIEAPEFIKVVC